MLGAAADLLDQGQSVNRLSIAVTAIAVAVLLLPIFPASLATVPTATVVALVGLIELFVAMRVNFDAQLFRRLARDATEGHLDIDTSDSALQSIRVLPVRKAGRPVAKRIAGAKRLLIWQSFVLLVQTAAAIVGGSLVFWGFV
jgi:hypothetical protein